MLIGWLLLVLTVLVAHANADQSAFRFQRGYIESPSPSEFLYQAQIGPLRVYCRPDGISIVAAHKLSSAHRVDMDFPVRASRIIASEQRSEYYRFIHSKNQHIAHAFEQLRYCDVAPGVDLVLRWNSSHFKYDVIAHPGGRLDQFRFIVRGARIERIRGGTVQISCGTEQFLDAPPIAYQFASDGTQVPVTVCYTAPTDSTIGFRITSAYDSTRPLVIDPAIVWSTYLGGSQEDAANDIATDAAGNIYVAGNTRSIDFPLRGTTANRGRQNIVVAKFTATGQHLWSTYFGGEQDEVAKAIVAEPSGGMLYVGGWSSSPSVILDQPYPNRSGGAFDAVVLAFAGDGSFVRGTFLGGSREELINGLALRRDGSLIAVGRTNSNDFPVAQAQQPVHAGDNDIFVTALSLPTLQVLWSTYYGGSAFDEAYGVAVSPGGSVFVTGVTVSTDFPTANAMQPRPTQLDNAFVLALNSAGRRIWATYLGGNDYDLGNRLVYWNGALYVAGTTSSADFPIQGDSIAQREKSGYNDAFLACISEAGTLQWSTFWGGQLAESGFSILALGDGRIVLAGSTSSTDFPRRQSILWSARGGDDIFIALFRDGQNLWSATIGGSGDDILYGMALLPSGDIVGTGETRSRDFEPLVNAQYTPSTSPVNRSDCFLFRLCTFASNVMASSPNRVLCNGQAIELWASDSSAIATIVWNTGSTARRIRVTAAGEYWFTATSTTGCTIVSDTVRITTTTAQPVQLDTIAPRRGLRLCQGERIGFVVRGRYRSHAWLDERGGLITTNDTLWVETSGTYHAIVEDTNGCTLQSASHRVEVTARPLLRYLQLLNGQWTALTTDTLAACSGIPIVLDIERPASAQCLWSDGFSTCQRTITSDTQLSAMITDSTGCRWTMPMVVCRFTQRIAPTIDAPDTVCVELPFVARSSSGRMRWNIPSGLRIHSSTTDSTRITLSASAPGVYRLQTWIADACSDTVERVVTVVEPQSVRIMTTAPSLCPGQHAILRAPSGFTEYRWNSVAGDSMLVVSDSGWYRLEVHDRFGCIARDSIYVRHRAHLRSSDTIIDFGVLEVGQNAQRRITLSNPNDTAAPVVFLLANGVDFSISPASGIGTVPPSDTFELELSYNPTGEGGALDTLIIVQRAPCVDTLRVIVTGQAFRRRDQPIAISFAIEDVVISPLDPSVSIRLYAWSASPSAQDIDTLWLELHYNPTMLLPQEVTPGSLTVLPAQGERGQLHLMLPIDTIPAERSPNPLAILRAAVLLGDSEIDSLDLTRATSTLPLLYQPTASIVRYTDLCRIGGVRLLGQNRNALLLVTPNPSDGNATVLATPMEKGKALLDLFSSDGRHIWHTGFDAKAGTPYAFVLPPLPAGSYFLRLSTESGWFHWTPVIIIR